MSLTERMTKLTAQKNTIVSVPHNAIAISERSNTAGSTTDARATTPTSADIADSRSRWSAFSWNNAIDNIIVRADTHVKRVRDALLNKRSLATGLGALCLAVLLWGMSPHIFAKITE